VKSPLLWSFRQVYRTSRWFRSRYTAAGMFLLGFMLTAGVLGVDTHQSQFYQLFALLAALLLTALLLGRWCRVELRHIAAQRQLPRCVTRLEPFSYRVLFTNLGSHALAGLSFRDNLRETWVEQAGFAQFHTEHDHARNWFDRAVGYPRFVEAMRQRAGGVSNETDVPKLPPGGQVSVSVQLTPLRRGYIEFESANLYAPEPLGLYKSVARLELRERLLVLPRRHPVAPLGLLGNRRFQPGGVNQSSLVGDSMEFAGLREYRHGDPPKQVHWKSWARTGQPYVKQYQDEYFVRHALILDSFPAPGALAVFEEAIEIAASFATARQGQDDLLDLMFAGDRVHQITSGRGLAGPEQLLEALACLHPGPSGGFIRLAQAVEGYAECLSNAICVLVQWDLARQTLVQKLLRRNLPVLVLVVRPAGDAVDAREALDPGPMAARREDFHEVPVGHTASCLARL
jgi:uncharacterized protein (DUF58 family)